MIGHLWGNLMSNKNGIKYIAAASLLALSLNFSSANLSYAANTPSVDPVSYTHLDVYKRQGLLKAPSKYSPVSSTERAAQRATVVLNVMENEGVITHAPVSYTHLDVYKRQS